MIDSWVWIEYWRGARHAKAAAVYIEGEEDAIVSAVNLAELYHWVLRAYDETTAEAKKAEVMNRCLVLALDTETAIAAARVKVEEKMALADSIVLATGRASGASVITGDADFKGKAGVKYIGS